MYSQSSSRMRGNFGPLFGVICLVGGLIYCAMLYRTSNRQLRFSETKLAKLSKQYSSLTSQLNVALESKQRVEMDFGREQSAHESSKRAIAMHKDQAAELEKRYNDLKSELEGQYQTLKTSHTELQSKHADLEFQHKKLSDDKKVLEEGHEKVEADLKDTADKHSQLQSELQELKLKLEKTEGDYKNSQDQLQSAKSEHQAASSERDRLKEEVDNLNQRLDAQQNELQNLQRVRAALGASNHRRRNPQFGDRTQDDGYQQQQQPQEQPQDGGQGYQQERGMEEQGNSPDGMGLHSRRGYSKVHLTGRRRKGSLGGGVPFSQVGAGGRRRSSMRVPHPDMGQEIQQQQDPQQQQQDPQQQQQDPQQQQQDSQQQDPQHHQQQDPQQQDPQQQQQDPQQQGDPQQQQQEPQQHDPQEDPQQQHPAVQDVDRQAQDSQFPQRFRPQHTNEEEQQRMGTVESNERPTGIVADITGPRMAAGQEDFTATTQSDSHVQGRTRSKESADDDAGNSRSEGDAGKQLSMSKEPQSHDSVATEDDMHKHGSKNDGGEIPRHAELSRHDLSSKQDVGAGDSQGDLSRNAAAAANAADKATSHSTEENAGGVHGDAQSMGDGHHVSMSRPDEPAHQQAPPPHGPDSQDEDDQRSQHDSERDGAAADSRENGAHDRDANPDAAGTMAAAHDSDGTQSQVDIGGKDSPDELRNHDSDNERIPGDQQHSQEGAAADNQDEDHDGKAAADDGGAVPPAPGNSKEGDDGRPPPGEENQSEDNAGQEEKSQQDGEIHDENAQDVDAHDNHHEQDHDPEERSHRRNDEHNVITSDEDPEVDRRIRERIRNG
eukprot:scpid34702/ scgid3298/ Golgi integral membrane protein 4; Golgi integral membrane protein, cis; Golgi phosphoprotein 4; Golgi-localized phosphoprotein of 130 kDa